MKIHQTLDSSVIPYVKSFQLTKQKIDEIDSGLKNLELNATKFWFYCQTIMKGFRDPQIQNNE